jgi:hypothetical protein
VKKPTTRRTSRAGSNTSRRGQPSATAPTGGVAPSIRLQTVARQPIEVRHLDAPPRFVRRESIHPRRFLPRVREGKERQFHSQTRPAVFGAPTVRMFGDGATPDDLTVVVNTQLSEPGAKQMASNVGEPSVAANRNVVMYTGNWYTARSIDGGKTFQYIDPFKSFPDPPNLSFCCDQVVNYIPSIDTFVWLLQYGVHPGLPQADNIQRLAFAKTDDVAAGRWRLFDITTRSLGVSGQFMDFPDLAVGANALYATTNLFTSAGQSSGAAVVRIPFDSIASGQVVATSFKSDRLNSFRVAQNCGTRAFFAAHADTSTLQVYTWEEGQAEPVPNLVEVARWIGGAGYHSRTPDGRTWLDRADPRITGATLAGTDLYFAWAVNLGSNQRPQPFVQIARIDAASLTLLENINVFDPDSATCYGALSTNADGEVGIAYMIGGGPRFPSAVVGILTNARKDLIVATGDRGPLANSSGGGEWGDYLSVRPVHPDRKLFAASGYAMNGAGDGSNRDVTPRLFVFGRAQNAASAGSMVMPSQAGAALFSRPPAQAVRAQALPRDVPAPVDVNSLGVVSPEVAAKIKAAAGLGQASEAASLRAEAATPVLPEQNKPGTERWPVKTAQDPDRGNVGRNVIDSEDLGAGIVESTVAELGSLPRPPGLEDIRADPPEFQSVRDGVAEVTIWRIEAKIIALKHEADGDYHLVLQGLGGEQMIAEIPTPSTRFVGDSPWLDNFAAARREIDDKLVRHLSPAAFGLVQGKFMPHAAMMFQPREAADPGISFVTPPPGSPQSQPLFQTAIQPTAVRVTGVGFFDREHGATGAAPNVIELHPVLKVEWT